MLAYNQKLGWLRVSSQINKFGYGSSYQIIQVLPAYVSSKKEISNGNTTKSSGKIHIGLDDNLIEITRIFAFMPRFFSVGATEFNTELDRLYNPEENKFYKVVTIEKYSNILVKNFYRIELSVVNEF